jgi:steroid delta-isomerase-like uncharacterized protein
LWRAAFPDFTSQIYEMIAEEDRIATRWSFEGTHLGDYHGIPPTGHRVRLSGMTFNRVRDGLLAEEWVELNHEGLLRQIAGEE